MTEKPFPLILKLASLKLFQSSFSHIEVSFYRSLRWIPLNRLEWANAHGMRAKKKKKKKGERPKAFWIHFYDDFPFNQVYPIIFSPSTFLLCVVLCCHRRFNKKVSILFALLKRKINFWFSEICIHSFNWFEYKWKLIRSIFSSSLVRDIYIVWIMVSLRLLHQ